MRKMMCVNEKMIKIDEVVVVDVRYTTVEKRLWHE